MARIKDSEAIARRHLDQAAPHRDPFFDLPVAEHHLVHHKPLLEAQRGPICGAKARRGEPMSNRAPIPYHEVVACRLAPNHDGPHISQVRWELPGVWGVWTWDGHDGDHQ